MAPEGGQEAGLGCLGSSWSTVGCGCRGRALGSDAEACTTNANVGLLVAAKAHAAKTE